MSIYILGGRWGRIGYQHEKKATKHISAEGLQTFCTLLLRQCHSKAGYTLFIFRILRMFSRKTPRNMKHSLYTFRISCKFRVLLMPQKIKQNPLSLRKRRPWHLAQNGNSEKRDTKCEKINAKYLATYFLFFTFHDCFAYFAISV